MTMRQDRDASERRVTRNETMHSRGSGRRRIKSRTSRNSTPNDEFQLDEINPDNEDATPHAARPAMVLAAACCSGCVTVRVKLVLQFTASLVLFNFVLRFASLTTTTITTWLTENNGPVSSAAISRNQQRMERRRQRRRQNSAGNINMGEAMKELENWKVPFREHEELMNPHDSHPPDVIPLFSQSTTAAATSLLYLSETALQRRHECIVAIRKRHDELLRPFLTATAVRRNHETQQQEEEEHHLQERIAAFLPLRPEVLLVDPAYHKNVGDHMITLGEIAFLQRMGYTATVSLTTTRQRETSATENLNAVYDECSYIQGGPFLPLCDDFLLKKQQQQQQQGEESGSFLQVALWHGGGNWGDLWPKVQSMRASSLEPLFTALYNPIISMPQSLYFDDEKVFQKENTNVMRQAVMKKMKQASASTPKQQGLNDLSLVERAERRLVLTWREQKSHDMARKLYPFATHLIVPDIAFQLGPYAPIIENSLGEENDDKTIPQKHQRPQLDILLLLRDDHESLYLHQRNRQAIRQMLSSITVKRNAAGTSTATGRAGAVAGNRLLFAIVDWPDRLDRFESSSSSFGKRDIFFTNTSIQLLSLGRVLVCDRLHAAILAYLMGIPFVFVDQSTGKIHQTLHTAFTSASFLAGNANHNDTTTTAAGDHSPCLDATTAMWAQANNLTHALEKAIGFLDSGN